MLIFVPVRTLSARDIEALRQETTSATRHDFMAPLAVSDTVPRVRAAVAGALGVSLEALEAGARPESFRVVGRRGMTTTLVEANIFRVGTDGATVQLAASSRDRVSPTLMVMVLAFVGMTIAFFGGFAAGLSPVLTAVATCVLPFGLGLPYVSMRRRVVENSSKSLFAAFRAVEVEVVAGTSAGTR